VIRRSSATWSGYVRARVGRPCQTPNVSNLADYVRDSAAARPSHRALVAGERTLTWLDVDRAVDAVASGLRSLGLQVGDRLGLVVGNQVEFVTCYFGALRAGLVVVPLNPGYTQSELEHAVRDSEAAGLVVDREVVDRVRPYVDASEAVLVVTTGSVSRGEHLLADVSMAGRAKGAIEEPTDAAQLAVVLYTSGTSGRPKGAMLTHRALRASVEQVAQVQPPVVSGDDVVLVLLPLFHVYTLNGTLGAWAHAGATAVLVERFDPVSTLALVAQHGVTNIPAAPPVWHAWAALPDLARRLAGVRLLFSGAAALPGSVLDQIMQATGIPLYEGYGLTEAAPGVTSTIVSGRPKAGSIGQPFPGVEVRLLDEDGGVVDEGDPGEIWIRGDNLFSGYWPDGAGGPNDEGWFATGDVAYADGDGDLVLVDRRKELIIVNGFNVYPREVEEALQGVPGVVEAAVVGVPDEAAGESVKAYVVVDDASLTAQAVAEQAALTLARFKRPSAIEVVEELPHSVTGKVAKGQLRADAGE
jgi:long-chain acyl-CoA synthetase